MALTVLGTFLGMTFAMPILSSGFGFLLIVAELAIIFTSRLWMDKSPLNALLFGLFPVLSGLTFAPYLMYVLAGYANGGAILMNAFAATAFMAGAAGVFAKTTTWNLTILGKALFFALLGLILMGVLQIFIPGLRGGALEVLLSGAGVVIFALFTAYDVQRVGSMARLGANPFMLALSLYLDIFNLFLYILRFMIAISGNRR